MGMGPPPQLDLTPGLCCSTLFRRCKDVIESQFSIDQYFEFILSTLAWDKIVGSGGAKGVLDPTVLLGDV